MWKTDTLWVAIVLLSLKNAVRKDGFYLVPVIERSLLSNIDDLWSLHNSVSLLIFVSHLQNRTYPGKYLRYQPSQQHSPAELTTRPHFMCHIHVYSTIPQRWQPSIPPASHQDIVLSPLTVFPQVQGPRENAADNKSRCVLLWSTTYRSFDSEFWIWVTQGEIVSDLCGGGCSFGFL